MGGRGSKSKKPAGAAAGAGAAETAEQAEARVQAGYKDKYDKVAERAESVHTQTDQAQETADNDFANWNKGKGKPSEHLANLRSGRDFVHCGAPLGEYFMMIAFNCDHYILIGAECCNPRMGGRRPQTRLERDQIEAEVAAIFEAR